MKRLADRFEPAVYPGHAITIAYFITFHYQSFSSAVEKKTNESCAQCLGDNRIPGAGGCVYSALDMLSYIMNGTLSIDEAFEFADKAWAYVDDQKSSANRHARWLKGQEQADKIKPKLRERLLTWSWHG